MMFLNEKFGYFYLFVSPYLPVSPPFPFRTLPLRFYLPSLSPSLSVRLSSTSSRKPIEDIQDRWVISEASSSSSQVRYHPHSLTVNIVRNPKSKVQRSILCPLQFSPRHHIIFRRPLIYSRSPLILHPSPYFLNIIYIIYFHSFSLFRNLLLLSFLSSPSTISYYTI